MLKQHKTFLINHSQDAIDFLEQIFFIEQPAVITSLTEESPMKILINFEKKTWFALSIEKTRIAKTLARSINGEYPKETTVEALRREVANG